MLAARARMRILCVPILLSALLSACDGVAVTSSGASIPNGNGSAATLSWSAPTENTNGTALTNLAGYHIHYGTNIASLDQEISIPTTDLTTYEIDGLNAGTYFFAITSYSTDGNESAYSAIVSATIS
jgi:hypothetical protein